MGASRRISRGKSNRRIVIGNQRRIRTKVDPTPDFVPNPTKDTPGVAPTPAKEAPKSTPKYAGRTPIGEVDPIASRGVISDEQLKQNELQRNIERHYKSPNRNYRIDPSTGKIIPPSGSAWDTILKNARLGKQILVNGKKVNDSSLNGAVDEYGNRYMSGGSKIVVDPDGNEWIYNPKEGYLDPNLRFGVMSVGNNITKSNSIQQAAQTSNNPSAVVLNTASVEQPYQNPNNVGWPVLYNSVSPDGSMQNQFTMPGLHTGQVAAPPVDNLQGLVQQKEAGAPLAASPASSAQPIGQVGASMMQTPMDTAKVKANKRRQSNFTTLLSEDGPDLLGG